MAAKKGSVNLTHSQTNVGQVIFDCCCTPCDIRKFNREATKYCVNCSLLYCAKCAESHKQFMAFSNHVLLDLKTPTPGPIRSRTRHLAVSTELCKRHLKLVDMYCVEEDVVGCSACVLLDHKSCSDIHYIPEYIQSSFPTEPVIQINRKLTNAIKDMGKLKTKYDNLNENLDKSKAKCKLEIQKYRNDINQIFDQIEETTLAELDARHKETRKETDYTNQNIHDLQNEMVKLKSEIESDQSNDFQKFVSAKLSKCAITQSEELLSESSHDRTTEFKFTRNTDIMTFLMSIVTLGMLNSPVLKDVASSTDAYSGKQPRQTKYTTPILKRSTKDMRYTSVYGSTRPSEQMPEPSSSSIELKLRHSVTEKQHLLWPSANEDTVNLKSFSAVDSNEEKNTLHQKQTSTLRKRGKRMFLSDPLDGTCGVDTYGHSDYSTDDSDNSKKWGLTGQGKKRRNKRKSKWIIDPAAWKTCISSHNTFTLVDLLKEKKLPDNNLLNEAYKVYELNFIRLICDEICKYIVQKSSHIIYVYPATMVTEATNESDACTITFVVVLGEMVDLGNDFNFQIKNTSDPAAQENFQIKILEKKEYVLENETDSNIARLTKCIQKHSTALKKNHTNVCRISLSGFKSSRFGKVGESMKQIDCISLYVCAKGFIPLGENLLPTTLDVDGCQVLVDVREGFVEAYTGKHGPCDTLTNLRMGCSIGVEPRTNGEAVNGTLGGFFEMGGADFCMSSAHIVLSANEMKLLEMQDTPLLERIDLAKHVYQPHDNYIMPFGRGRTAVYKEGGNGATGVDVVSILIENRNPNTGEFPMSDRGQDSDKKYSRGKVYNREEIRYALKSNAYRRFYKYGCGTGWTTGKFRSECASFRAPHPVQDGNTDFQICLHNQFELHSDTDKDFAGKSDSGALVFMEDGEELVAVGMVVAGMADEVCFVTPLDEIFKALKLDSIGLKTFTTEGNGSVSNESDEVSVNAELTELKCDISNVKTDVEDIKFSMRDMERDMKSEINDMKSEMNDMKSDIKDVQYSVNNRADKMEGRLEDIMSVLRTVQFGNQQNS